LILSIERINLFNWLFPNKIGQFAKDLGLEAQRHLQKNEDEHQRYLVVEESVEWEADPATKNHRIIFRRAILRLYYEFYFSEEFWSNFGLDKIPRPLSFTPSDSSGQETKQAEKRKIQKKVSLGVYENLEAIPEEYPPDPAAKALHDKYIRKTRLARLADPNTPYNESPVPKEQEDDPVSEEGEAEEEGKGGGEGEKSSKGVKDLADLDAEEYYNSEEEDWVKEEEDWEAEKEREGKLEGRKVQI